MFGGAGNDSYFVDSTPVFDVGGFYVSGDWVNEDLDEGVDTVSTSISYTLPEGVENLTLTGTAALTGTGNELANAITGNSGKNLLTGGAGNDTLNGGAGADTLLGGIGNDTYVVDVATDIVTENANEGIDTVQSTVTWTLGGNFEKLALTGTTAINGTGNALDNVLTGNSGVNSLTGGAGNDTLDGGAGKDTMVGGLGDDYYYVSVATDVVTEAATAGNDTVNSFVTYTLGTNVENLTLSGSAVISGTGNTLNNLLQGNGMANTLTGAAGNDTLDGGAGTDSLVGGAGNDSYYVDVSTDTITELANEGVDAVFASASWTLGSNLEDLTLSGTGATNGTGNTLNNRLAGNGAANTLTGGAGNDTLDGGAGIDSLVGGVGADSYVFGRGYGADLVIENDITVGVKDAVLFGAGIVQADVGFTRSGNALIASILGTSDALTIQDWYLGNQYHLEEFRFTNGAVVTDVQAQALVSAMAAFAPSEASAVFMPANEDVRRHHHGLAVSAMA